MASIRRGRRGKITRALDTCNINAFIHQISNSKVNLPSNKEDEASFQDILDREIEAGCEVINLIKDSKQFSRNGLTPLEAAVILGHYNIVKELIDEGVSVSHYLKDKHPLYIALERGHFDIASLLLKHDADAVNTDFHGIYPMLMALERTECSVDIVKELIEVGFPENGIVDNRTRETALHAAIKCSNHKVMQYLLSLPNIDCDSRDRQGQTPLHYSVMKDCRGSVILLAKRGSNLNCECFQHITPLIYTISIGNYNMVKILLDLGADIRYVYGNKKCSMSPLHFAVRCCQLKITQLLLDHGADIENTVPLTGATSLHMAAVADPLDKQANKIGLDCIVEMLIKRGAEVDRKDMFNFTALHLAIKHDNSSVAKMLIQNGANVNKPTGGTKTEYCLHLACLKLDKELIRMLVDYGADMFARNEIGYPCHYAVASLIELKDNVQTDFQMGIFRYLWSRGFPFDLTLKVKPLEIHLNSPPKLYNQVQKQKLLFTGVKNLQIKSLCKAMAQGAELNCCSSEIRFPLHYGASRGSEQVIALLLYGRQVVNWLDKRCESALHLGAKAGHTTCCRLLLEHGAVYNHSNQRCTKTPLQLAKELGHHEVAFMLTTIGKHFRDARKKKFRKLHPEMRFYAAIMNCRDRNGRSLMETAVHFEAKEMVEQLMVLRIHMVYAPQSYY